METRKTARRRDARLGATILGATATVTVACFLILMGTLCGMQRVAGAEAFAPRTVIDGVTLDSQTYAEGERSVQQAKAAILGEVQITLRYNGSEKTFGAEELGVSTNSEELIRQAYARNKKGELLTDFNLSSTAFAAESKLVLDEARIVSVIEGFLRENDIPAQNAEAIFASATRTFTYTPEASGVRADAAKVISAVKQKLTQGDYQPLVIDIAGQLAQRVEPAITKEQLEHSTALIGKCTTVASDDADRNVNIQLMCEAVDGLVLAPGETLSLNELVGKRTEAKGFRAAPAIVDGQLTNSIGGGICQLAGTLYNAALLADMEIVERVHHTWPSEYLPIGLDATLNWDNKDLKIKNRSDYPLYISASLNKPSVTVEIYGAPPEEGLEIDIDNQIIKEVVPPAPELIYTNKLPAGVERVKDRSRKGYEVVIYRRYWRDGEMVGTELISRDHFRAIRGTNYVGTDITIK